MSINGLQLGKNEEERMARADEGGKSPDFHISEKWRKVYEGLCKRGRSRSEGYFIFDKYTNLYTLCASIGHMIPEEKDLEKPYSPFTLEQIDEDNEWPILRAIAWSKSGNSMDIFVKSREVVRICDRFAEAGMTKIYNDLLKEHMEGGYILNPESIDLEIKLSFLIESIKKEASLV